MKHLGTLGQAAEFIKDQYRHAKTILALGDAAAVVESAGVPRALRTGEPDPGVLFEADGDGVVQRFASAIARHRHHEREMDPPEV